MLVLQQQLHLTMQMYTLDGNIVFLVFRRRTYDASFSLDLETLVQYFFKLNNILILPYIFVLEYALFVKQNYLYFFLVV